MSNDNAICHSVKVAMNKIEEQHGLGANAVQGRLHDIHELAYQLLQDLEAGVYGRPHGLHVKPQKPYKTCKYCGKPL